MSLRSSQDELAAGQQGVSAADRLFGGSVADLERRFKAGEDIEEQSNRLSKKIGNRARQLRERLKDIGDFQQGETDAITERRIRYY